MSPVEGGVGSSLVLLVAAEEAASVMVKVVPALLHFATSMVVRRVRDAHAYLIGIPRYVVRPPSAVGSS